MDKLLQCYLLKMVLYHLKNGIMINILSVATKILFFGVMVQCIIRPFKICYILKILKFLLNGKNDNIIDILFNCPIYHFTQIINYYYHNITLLIK